MEFIFLLIRNFILKKDDDRDMNANCPVKLAICNRYPPPVFTYRVVPIFCTVFFKDCFDA